MSQYLPTGDFKEINILESDDLVQCDELLDEIKEDILSKPDGDKYGYFKECDSEYPAEIEKKPKFFHFVIIKQNQI